VPQAWDVRYDPVQVEANYDGMTVSELRRLKDPETENSELKGLLVDATLERSFCAIGSSTMASAGLQGLLAKNS